MGGRFTNSPQGLDLINKLSINKGPPQKSIPAADFFKTMQPSVGDVLNKEQRIYMTLRKFFATNFRQIFTNMQITHTSAKEARRWLSGANMSYWPQQLNFAL